MPLGLFFPTAYLPPNLYPKTHYVYKVGPGSSYKWSYFTLLIGIIYIYLHL